MIITFIGYLPCVSPVPSSVTWQEGCEWIGRSPGHQQGCRVEASYRSRGLDQGVSLGTESMRLTYWCPDHKGLSGLLSHKTVYTRAIVKFTTRETGLEKEIKFSTYLLSSYFVASTVTQLGVLNNNNHIFLSTL